MIICEAFKYLILNTGGVEKYIVKAQDEFGLRVVSRDGIGIYKDSSLSVKRVIQNIPSAASPPYVFYP